MRNLVIAGLMLVVCSGFAFAQPVPPPTPCDPILHNHTNPPVGAGKGNSVSWWQCDRATQDWVPLTADYHVFNHDDCNPVSQFLDPVWFGTATELAKLTKKNGQEKVISKLVLESTDYILTIDFKTPKKNKYRPNEIELCKKGGVCCGLAPGQGLHGKIPIEFENFDDQNMGYGLGRKGKIPMTFESCETIGCEQ